MAADEATDPRLTPSFAAQRFFVPATEAGSESELPAAGDGEWRWIGDAGLLGELGLAAGKPVEASVYSRVIGGHHASEDSRFRKANTVRGEPDPGLVQVRGSYGAPEAIAATWRASGPEARERLGEWLIAETNAGIGRVAAAERVVAAAAVNEVGAGAETTVRVEWVALGADRGKGLASPYDRKGINQTGAFERETAERLRAGLEQRSRQAERQPRAERESEPVAAEIAEPAAVPLRDSLGASRKLLGDAAALEIRARAEKAAAELELDQLADEELRQALPAPSPYASLGDGPRRDPAALRQWWRANGEAAVRTTAIEERLIDRARAGYEALAERESARRGEATPNPIAQLREARGEEFAAKVDRRAAVLASHLDAMPPEKRQEQQALTAGLREEIGRDGLAKARFETIARSVALQHDRNRSNEQEAAARQLEAGRGHQRAADVGPALD